MANEFDGYKDKQFVILQDTIDTYRRKVNKIAHSIGSLNDLISGDSDVVEALNNLLLKDSDLQDQINQLKLVDSDLQDQINNIGGGPGGGADSDWVLALDSDIYDYINGRSLDDVNQVGNITTREIILPKIKINDAGINSGIELTDSDFPIKGGLKLYLDSDTTKVILNTNSRSEFVIRGQSDSDLNRIILDGQVTFNGTEIYDEGDQINSGYTKTPGLVVGHNANTTFDLYRKEQLTPTFLTQWVTGVPVGNTVTYNGHPGTYINQDGIAVISGDVVHGTLNIEFDTTGFDGGATIIPGAPIYIRNAIPENYPPLSDKGILIHIDPTSTLKSTAPQLYLTLEDGPGAVNDKVFKLIRSDATTVNFNDSEVPEGIIGNLSFSYSYIAQTIINNDPIFAELNAYAGMDAQIVDTETSGTLDGTGSLLTPNATIQWSQVTTEAITIDNPNSLTTTFNIPDVDPSGLPLEFKLVLTDTVLGLSDSDTVSYIITDANQGPVANAGNDQIVNENSGTITLDGSASTDDTGIISYQWTQLSGTIVTITNDTSAIATFQAPDLLENSISEDLTFELTVTDGAGLTSTDTTIVTVNEVLDTAPLATYNITITEPDQTTINTYNDQDDGSYSGTEGVVSGGVYELEQKPGSSISISSIVTDPDYNTVNYTWTQTAGAPISVTNPTQDVLQFTIPDNSFGDTFTFELTIETTNNSSNTTKSDTTTITLVPADPNIYWQPTLTANAGVDDTKTFTTNVGFSFNLNGTGSTGAITTYAWTETTGIMNAGGGVITNGNTATPTVTFPDNNVDSNFDGQVMQFQLTISDGTNTSIDTVNIILAEAVIANAGPDVTIFEGSSTVLDGSASTGNNLTYSWIAWGSKASRVQLTNANTPNPTLSIPDGLLSDRSEETFTARLTVTSAAGASSSDYANVTVQEVVIAEAGQNQTVAEGTANVQLDGSASIGTNLTYSWTQLSGTTVTLSNANSVNPTFTSPLVTFNEDLTFQLTVDNGNVTNGTDTDTVTITVQDIQVETQINLQSEYNVSNQAVAGTTNKTYASITVNQTETNIEDQFVEILSKDEITLIDNTTLPPGANITSYLWERVDLNGNVTGLPTNSPTETITFTVPSVTQLEEISYKLTVTTDLGSTTSSYIHLLINNVVDTDDDVIGITSFGLNETTPGQIDIGDDAFIFGFTMIMYGEFDTFIGYPTQIYPGSPNTLKFLGFERQHLGVTPTIDVLSIGWTGNDSRIAFINSAAEQNTQLPGLAEASYDAPNNEYLIEHGTITTNAMQKWNWIDNIPSGNTTNPTFTVRISVGMNTPFGYKSKTKDYVYNNPDYNDIGNPPA